MYYYTTYVGTVGVLGALGGEGLWNSKCSYICFTRNLYSKSFLGLKRCQIGHIFLVFIKNIALYLFQKLKL